MRIRSRVTHTLGLVAVVSILSIAGYAFTASNSLPSSNAGDGVGAVNGYQVANITWSLVGNNPPRYNGVQFDIPLIGGIAQPSVVRIQVTGSPNLVDCDPIDSETWTCGFSSRTVQSLTSFRVIAAQ